MCKKIMLLFAVLMLPVSLFAGPYDDMAKELLSKGLAKKGSVAVMPFNFEHDKDGSRILADEMSRALNKAGATVVERNQLDKIMKEHELQQTGIVSDQFAVQTGKGLGAKYIVVGSAAKFTKTGYENQGIKISVRLIDVETFKIISASSGEVDAGDKTSVYRNTGVKRAAEYPGFLELFGGGTILKDRQSYSNTTSTADLKTGFIVGLRYLTSAKGFFTWGYEFNYMNETFKNSGKAASIFNINLPLLARIPLWSYINSLPAYTHIYFGIIPGVSGGTIPYKNGASVDTATMFGFINIDPVIGFKFGLSDNVSIFAEYRYKFASLNYIWHTEPGSLVVTNHFTGHLILAGISLAP